MSDSGGLAKVIQEAAERSDSRPWWRLSYETQCELAAIEGLDLETWRKTREKIND